MFMHTNARLVACAIIVVCLMSACSENVTVTFENRCRLSVEFRYSEVEDSEHSWTNSMEIFLSADEAETYIFVFGGSIEIRPIGGAETLAAFEMMEGEDLIVPIDATLCTALAT